MNAGAVDLIAFMPTPFTAEDGIDVAAVETQMEHYGRHAVHVGLMGGLGEFYALSHDEAELLMRTSVAAVAGRADVVAAIGFATREAVRLAEAAALAGCARLVINPPYYVKPSPRGLAEHVRAVTEAADLPAVLYSSAQHEITDDHLAELVDVDGFQGVKDEVSAPHEFAARVRRWGPRVDFWAVGEHTAAPYLEAGAAAVTSALASVCPQASRLHLAGTEGSAHLAGLVMESVRMLGAEPGAGASAAKHMIAAARPWPTRVRGPQAEASATLVARIGSVVDRIRGEWGE